MNGSAGFTSLAETLRAFTDDELAALFRARPDALQPVPNGFDQLAARLTTRTSLLRALDKLDRATLAVLEAASIVSERSEATIADALGDPEIAASGLTRLRELALVWGPAEELRVPAALEEAIGPEPAGLGPPAQVILDITPDARIQQLARDLGLTPGPGGNGYPFNDGDRDVDAGGRSRRRVDLRDVIAAALADPARVHALLVDAGDGARRAAERLATDGPIGTLPNADRPVAVATATTPAEQLLARGLLLHAEDDYVILPREVGLALRHGRLYDPAELRPPAPTGARPDPTLVDRTAAGAALEVVRLMERLLEAWSSAPPAALRTGGVGVRDLRRTAKYLEVDEPRVALLVECAAEARLLAADDERWLPTTAYDVWLAADPALRWARLAVAWWGSPRLPSLVGTRDDRNRVRAALAPGLERGDARRARRLLLDALNVGGDEPTAPDREQVLARVEWAAPRWSARFGRSLLEALLAEAGTLGLTGLGALATYARELVGGADADGLAAALRPHLPEPVDHVLLQADLTAVAPGPLRLDLANELGLIADAESHGGATVYRFSEASIRRAFDRGKTAAEIHELLAGASATPVPQPLTYLVDDVARRHGQLRVGPASSYVRSDDEAALTALLADRRAAELGLRRLAPTVLVSTSPPGTLVDTLRDLGYAPMPESATGAVAVTGPRPLRAEPPGRRYRPVEPAPLADEVLAAGVRAVRTADRARASRPDKAGAYPPRTASTGTIDVLREALGAGATVWLGYIDQHGSSSDRLVDPVRIEGGRLTAYDHAAGEARSFALHRITGAMRLDEPAG